MTLKDNTLSDKENMTDEKELKASFALHIIEEMKAVLGAMREHGGNVENYRDDMDMLMSFAFQLDEEPEISLGAP